MLFAELDTDEPVITNIDVDDDYYEQENEDGDPTISEGAFYPEDYTEEELEAMIAETAKCPEGVNEELWKQTITEMDEHFEDYKETVKKHVAAYDKEHPEPDPPKLEATQIGSQ